MAVHLIITYYLMISCTLIIFPLRNLLVLTRFVKILSHFACQTVSNVSGFCTFCKHLTESVNCKSNRFQLSRGGGGGRGSGTFGWNICLTVPGYFLAFKLWVWGHKYRFNVTQKSPKLCSSLGLPIFHEIQQA